MSSLYSIVVKAGHHTIGLKAFGENPTKVALAQHKDGVTVYGESLPDALRIYKDDPVTLSQRLIGYVNDADAPIRIENTMAVSIDAQGRYQIQRDQMTVSLDGTSPELIRRLMPGFTLADPRE